MVSHSNILEIDRDLTPGRPAIIDPEEITNLPQAAGASPLSPRKTQPRQAAASASIATASIRRAIQVFS